MSCTGTDTYYRHIQVVQVAPGLGRRVDDVDLTVVEGAGVPDAGEGRLGACAETAVRPREERDAAGLLLQEACSEAHRGYWAASSWRRTLWWCFAAGFIEVVTCHPGASPRPILPSPAKRVPHRVLFGPQFSTTYEREDQNQTKYTKYTKYTKPAKDCCEHSGLAYTFPGFALKCETKPAATEHLLVSQQRQRRRFPRHGPCHRARR